MFFLLFGSTTTGTGFPNKQGAVFVERSKYLKYNLKIFEISSEIFSLCLDVVVKQIFCFSGRNVLIYHQQKLVCFLSLVV